MRTLWRMSLLVSLLLIGWPIGSSDAAQDGTVVPRPPRCAGTITLTFDDGPDPELTPALLDVLQERGIQATFFVTGERIAGNETLIQRMVAEGHSVQNHTWDHPYLTQLSDEEIVEQLERTSAAIVAAGAPEPVYVRPPFGDYDTRVLEIVVGMGLSSVTWTNVLDTRDWEGITEPELIERVTSNLQSSGVVLLHDIQPNTVATAPALIEAIHHLGYCINPYRGEEFWTLDA